MVRGCDGQQENLMNPVRRMPSELPLRLPAEGQLTAMEPQPSHVDGFSARRHVLGNAKPRDGRSGAMAATCHAHSGGEGWSPACVVSGWNLNTMSQGESRCLSVRMKLASAPFSNG